jgi:hypothetical protein
MRYALGMRGIAVASWLLVACASTEPIPVVVPNDATDSASEAETDASTLFACGGQGLTCDARDEYCHVTTFTAQNGMPPPPPTFACETTDGAAPTCGDAAPDPCGCSESDTGDVTITDCK